MLDTAILSWYGVVKNCAVKLSLRHFLNDHGWKAHPKTDVMQHNLCFHNSLS